MEWLLLKIGADLIAAGNVLLGKEMLTRYVPNQRLFLLCVAIVSLPFAGAGMGLLVAHGDGGTLALALGAGGAYIASGYFYYRAMAATDAVRFGLFTQMGPLFTLPLSVAVLGEHLTAGRLVGFIVMFTFSTVPMLGGLPGRSWWAAGPAAALAASALGAGYGVLNKLLLAQFTVGDTFAMTRLGVVLGTVLLLQGAGCWTSGRALVALPWRYQAVLLGEQIVRLGVQALLTQALAWSDSTAMIAVLSGFGPLYVWLFSLALGRTSLRDPHLPRYAIALLGLLLGAILMAW